MANRTREMTIPDGPLTGWNIAVTRIEHDIDPMDDLYTLDLWPPDIGQPQPTHRFSTYRYGYGWHLIQNALDGEQPQLQAAVDWWLDNAGTPNYATHRILVAIDETTWSTRDEIAQRLGITIDELDPSKPYGQALIAAERAGLITWRNQRATPLAALTPTAYDTIHPDQPQQISADTRPTATALTNSHTPTVACAFPPTACVSPQSIPPGPPMTPLSTAPRHFAQPTR